jgi:ketosteroid isomerase-like protein
MPFARPGGGETGYTGPMRYPRIATPLIVSILSATFAAGSFASDQFAGSKQDQVSLRKTGEEIRAAFARGDLDAIMACHSPDVIKALAPDRYLVGREAVRADLARTFSSVRLEFVDNHVESTFFQGRTAVEESLFTIRATPLAGGTPFLFKGRSMVVYVRDRRSPTGWASIREIIQPAS